MNSGDEHWISLCDLFGGLAAFFVFVGVGLSMNFAPGHAAGGDDNATLHTDGAPGFQTIDANSNGNDSPLPPGMNIDEGVLKIHYSAKAIDHGQYLPPGNLTSICQTIRNRFMAMHADKVAIIGHASCAIYDNRNRTDLNKAYSEDCAQFESDFAVNAGFSALRAYELFNYCRTCEDKAVADWFKANRKRIIIEGRSEMEAGLDMNDGVPYCRNRHRPADEEAEYRRVDVQFIRKASPTLVSTLSE